MSATIQTRTDAPKNKIQEVNDIQNQNVAPGDKVKLLDTAEWIINLGLSHKSVQKILSKEK